MPINYTIDAYREHIDNSRLLIDIIAEAIKLSGISTKLTVTFNDDPNSTGFTLWYESTWILGRIRIEDGKVNYGYRPNIKRKVNLANPESLRQIADDIKAAVGNK